MDISKLNSLVELYFKKTEEVEGKRPFLKWLKPDKRTYKWEDITERIYKLTTKIKSLIKQGDRCLILSENRPYWLMTDISIMNAGGISVPIFTTYSANDYEYILNDCKPSLIFVSNQDQFNKIKKIINSDVIKIITFEEIDSDSLIIEEKLKDNDLLFMSIGAVGINQVAIFVDGDVIHHLRDRLSCKEPYNPWLLKCTGMRLRYASQN